MTYTIKPLEIKYIEQFNEQAAGLFGDYEILAQYRVFLNPLVTYTVFYDSSRYERQTIAYRCESRDAAIAAANDHHQKQIEKFLLPVE